MKSTVATLRKRFILSEDEIRETLEEQAKMSQRLIIFSLLSLGCIYLYENYRRL